MSWMTRERMAAAAKAAARAEEMPPTGRGPHSLRAPEGNASLVLPPALAQYAKVDLRRHPSAATLADQRRANTAFATTTDLVAE